MIGRRLLWTGRIGRQWSALAGFGIGRSVTAGMESRPAPGNGEGRTGRDC